MNSLRLLPPKPEGHVEAALPWYVNGTLAAAERIEVEQHLSTCAECRASHLIELRLRQQLRMTALAQESESAPDESNVTPAPVLYRPQTPTSPRRRMRRWRSSRALVPLLAAQAAVIAALGVGLLLISQGRGVAVYRTLTDRQTQAGTPVPTLRIVFEDDTTTGAIRTLLSRIGGTISAGPSASDVYTVTLIGPQTKGANDPDVMARWLRTQQGVLFAEAVASDAGN